jgi:hypothetical protein
MVWRELLSPIPLTEPLAESSDCRLLAITFHRAHRFST